MQPSRLAGGVAVDGTYLWLPSASYPGLHAIKGHEEAKKEARRVPDNEKLVQTDRPRERALERESSRESEREL